jgi:hypothetical protein
MEKCPEASGGFRRDLNNVRLNRRPLRWGLVNEVTVEWNLSKPKAASLFHKPHISFPSQWTLQMAIVEGFAFVADYRKSWPQIDATFDPDPDVRLAVNAE